MSRRNVRKRREASEEPEQASDDEELSARERLEAIKDLQKARVRSQGTATDNLAIASESTLVIEEQGDEVIGGYVKEQKKEDGKQIDPERERYIQEQLVKRLGRAKPTEETTQVVQKRADDLYAIPKALQAQRTEHEDVSAWMTGIVEVPLSVDHQLKNIEATEAAKKQLLAVRDHQDAEVQNGKISLEDLRRVSYPLRFGRQTGKEEAWRKDVLEREHQPREWKRKKH